MLKHINITQCPVCGCSTVCRESIEVDSYSKKPEIRYHCNGQAWETREFVCGFTVDYVPNFSSCQRKEELCKRNPRINAIVEHRKKVKEQVLTYLSKLKTDQHFKKTLLHEIDSVSTDLPTHSTTALKEILNDPFHKE